MWAHHPAFGWRFWTNTAKSFFRAAKWSPGQRDPGYFTAGRTGGRMASVQGKQAKVVDLPNARSGGKGA